MKTTSQYPLHLSSSSFLPFEEIKSK